MSLRRSSTGSGNLSQCLSVICAAAMVLSLDDPIAAQGVQLPPPLAVAETFTLRQLLSHTTGLGQTYVRDEDRGKPLTRIEQLERMPRPTCPPSECWSYADANYVLIEAILEAKARRRPRPRP